MKSVEFCYWLQGYFELGPHASGALLPDQCLAIRNHLKLVEKVEGKLSGFPAWLDAVLDVHESGLMADRAEGLESRAVKRITSKLALVFEHEIDQTYGGDQGEAQGLHDGPGRPQTFRC